MKPLSAVSVGLLLNDWENFVEEIRDWRRGWVLLLTPLPHCPVGALRGHAAHGNRSLFSQDSGHLAILKPSPQQHICQPASDWFVGFFSFAFFSFLLISLLFFPVGSLNIVRDSSLNLKAAFFIWSRMSKYRVCYEYVVHINMINLK